MSGKNWLPSMQGGNGGDDEFFGIENGETILSASRSEAIHGIGTNDEILATGDNDTLRVRSPDGSLRQARLTPWAAPSQPGPALPSRHLPANSARALRVGAGLLAAVLALSAPLGVGTAAAQDATLPTVSVSDVQAYEDESYMIFEVSLSRPSNEEVTVDFSTAGVTATKGTDFSGGSHTITFPPNREEPRRVGITIYDDLETEPDETFTFTLANPVGATLGNATATGTIRNDDTGATLSVSDIEDTTATLTIAGHTDGWWYKGGDFAGRNGHQCTAVAAGTTAVSIRGLTAAMYHYYKAYSDSTCNTRLAKVWFWTLAPEGATPTVSVSDAEVSEDGTWMQFRVSLSDPSREEVTVDYHTRGGTASSGTDYRVEAGTLTFPPNSRGQAVTVRVYDDQDPEPDETFTLTLTNPSGATLGDATATGTIRNDDTGATLSVSDIEDTTATLTIAGHTDGWWYKGEDFAGRNAHQCTAVAAGTTAVGLSGLTAATNYKYLAYSDSTCGTRLAKVRFGTLAPEGTPTVSVSDAEVSEDGKWMEFKVSLSHPSRERVFVPYVTTSGTATKGIDFRSGTWGDGHVQFDANRPQTVTSARVRVYDDQEPEPDETFTLRLVNPTGATLGDAKATGTILDDGDTAATLSAGDIEDTTATLTLSGHTGSWWYRGRREGACTAVAAGTKAVGLSGLTAVTTYEYFAFSDGACRTKLANAEFRTIAPEGTPTVSVSDAQVFEDGRSLQFRVSLSHPSREEVVVLLETRSGTATKGIDFWSSSWGDGLVYFDANSSETVKHAYVRVIDDQDPEPDETFTLRLVNPRGATLADATATGTILDDGDTAATLSVSDIEDSTATLTIAGHTDGWWYRGRDEGTGYWWGACTAVAAGTTAVGVGGLRAVTSYNYFVYSDSACQTKLANVEFRTLAPEGTPTVSVSDAHVSEGGWSMEFKVSLSHPSREEVIVWFETRSGTATMGTDFESRRAGVHVYFGANSSETVKHARVRVIDDQEPEPDETFTLTLTNPTNATLGDATATGTILDDGDTAATLSASDIEDTTATLTIGGHTDGWWYRGREEGTSEWRGACTAVAAGTNAVSIGGLKAMTTYEYFAYSDSACGTKLANMEFRTIASEGTPTVSVSDGQVSEDGNSVRFWVSLSQPSREQVTVDYHTTGGTATSRTDFWPASHTLTFSPNSWDPRPLHVRVIDDQEPEPDETFTVTLTNPTNATLGDATATGTIVDDDTPATLSVSDIKDTTATLTIGGHTDEWWYKGKAHSCTAVAAGTTAVGLSGLTAVTTYEYTAYGDSGCQTKLANVEFKTLAPEGVTPTVSVSDAEVSEDGTWMQFWVSLSEPTREQVTVDVRTSDGTAASGTDFKATSLKLTFPPNTGDPELLPVLVHDDQEPEPDETFTVTLTNPTNATLGDATATGTILDDGDTGAVSVALVSDPGDDETYAAGEKVRVAVTFGEAVDVDTESGTPRLKLDLGGDDGAGERWAAYEDGSGTDTLAFAWTAAAPDEAADGVAVLADTLETDGGTIRSKATQTDAALGHAGLAHDPAHKVDAAPPQLLRGEIDGGTMTLHFSEALDPDSTGGEFRMAVETPERGVVGFRASGGVSVDGETVTVGMGAGYPRATAGLERNRVLYVRRADGDGALRDLAGNPVTAPHRMGSSGGAELRYIEIDLENVTRSVPRVTGVAVVSDAGGDDTYALGEKIRVRVTFDETVSVDTTGGTPRLKIKMDPRWGEFWADYASGDSTEALTFTHTVVEPNTSPQGIAVLANTLELNGGTIRSVATGRNARLAHAGLGHDPTHKVNWRLSPAGAPAVTGVAVVSEAGADDTYGLGETIRVRVTFGEKVSVDTTGGKPRLKIRMDPRWGEFWAGYKSGDGTANLTFTYTVAEPNTSPFGIAVLANTLETNGGAIRPAASGAQARLSHAGLGHDPSHKVNWRLSPADTPPPVAPAATGVAVVSDAGDDDTYRLGEKIRVRVTFAEKVSVDTTGGTPGLNIRMDPRWGTFRAAYKSGSGTAALTFTYKVAKPNTSPPGIAVLADTLALNGGTIRSAATGADAKLAHAGLGHDPKHKVDWRPGLSVLDARAHEGAGAVMRFAVTLDAATTEAVTVDYATADGTAVAGEDYTAVSGRLTFAAGQRAKGVSVAILDDALDEGEETFKLKLSNARGAWIEDGEATGTITNSDPLQKMWLSRFGRTVADHVTGAVSDRLSNPLAGAQLTVAGQTMNLAELEDEASLGVAVTPVARALGAASGPAPVTDPGSGPGQAPWPGTRLGVTESPTLNGTSTREISGREVLRGSAFHLTKEGDGGTPGLAAWGRVTVGGFDGEAPTDEGNVRIDGNVTTGILGADAEWGRMLAGVAVSVSEGEGTFAQPGVDAGTIESMMTTVSPYARVDLSDRLSAWGQAGVGTGDMTIIQKANDATGQPERMTRTDLAMRLAALGGRGALLKADTNGGLDLALRADAFYVETTSEAISNEGDTTAAASRVRLALEGSRAFQVGGGVLTPGLELGLRHDGGDAETGTGVELGGRVTWAGADSGLSMEASVRALVAHEDSDYEEWGASGSIRLDPGASGRGLTFSLVPTYGTPSGGVDRLWSARDARGLAPGSGTFEPESRLEGELGYGVALPGGFTGTPNLGFGLSNGTRDYRIGWRLAPAGAAGFEVNFDATRRESADLDGADPAPVEHGVLLRGSVRW